MNTFYHRLTNVLLILERKPFEVIEGKGHLVKQVCYEGQPGWERLDISLNLFFYTMPMAFLKLLLFTASLVE